MYKENALNLRFRQKKPFQPLEEHDKPINRPTCAVYIRLKCVWRPTRPLPEHANILISKETARNKACQTRHVRYKNWPEIYMDPNDTILTPNKKYKRVSKWTDICIQTINEKNTQTDTPFQTGVQNTAWHSTKVNSHIPLSPQLYSDSEETSKTGSAEISIEEEKRRMAQILGHINRNNSARSPDYGSGWGGRYKCPSPQDVVEYSCASVNGSGSRTYNGAIRAGKVYQLCTAVSP